MVILTSFKHAWPSVFSVLLHLICDLRSLLFCYVWPLIFSSHCSVTVDLWPAVFVLNLTHDLQSLLFCYIWPVTFSLYCSVTADLAPHSLREAVGRHVWGQRGPVPVYPGEPDGHQPPDPPDCTPRLRGWGRDPGCVRGIVYGWTGDSGWWVTKQS